RRGGALRFTGELNQSVTVTDHPALNPTDEITIATWVSADDWASNRRFLQKGDGDNQYRMLAENGDLVWEIDNVGRIEATLPPAGEWFHVAGTYDGSRMRLFVNGTPVGAAAATGEIPAVDQPL